MWNYPVTNLTANVDLLSINKLSSGLLFLGLTNLLFMLSLPKFKLDNLLSGFREITSLSVIGSIFCTTYIPPNLECLK